MMERADCSTGSMVSGHDRQHMTGNSGNMPGDTGNRRQRFRPAALIRLPPRYFTGG